MIDIAHRAKVSRTAVTHVLTGAGAGQIGGVSAAKATEIRRIAAELGYVPNLAAQQLAGKRSGMIGALSRTWNMATERRLLGWLQQKANARGFDVLGAQSNDRVESVETFLENCQSRAVDGLFVMAFASDDLWSQAAPLLSKFCASWPSSGIHALRESRALRATWPAAPDWESTIFTSKVAERSSRFWKVSIRR